MIAIPGNSLNPPTKTGYWLECDGQSLSRKMFPDLFNAINAAWGAADISSFNIPDMTGRFLRSPDIGQLPAPNGDPDRSNRIPSQQGGAGKGAGSLQGQATAMPQGKRNGLNAKDLSYSTDDMSNAKGGGGPAVAAINGNKPVVCNFSANWSTETCPVSVIARWYIKVKN